MMKKVLDENNSGLLEGLVLLRVPIFILLLLLFTVFFRQKNITISRLTNLSSLSLIEVWDQNVIQHGVVPTCNPDVDTLESKQTPIFIDLPTDENLGALVIQGRVYWLKGMCHEAQIILKNAIRKGSYPAAVLTIGISERTEFPVEMANQLSEYAYLNALMAQRNMRDEDIVVDWFEASYKLRPQFKTAERLAGIYYYSRGQREDVIRIWQVLEKELPSYDASKWWAAGQIAELENRWLDAAEYYQKGMSLSHEPEKFLERQRYALEKSNK